MTYDGLEEVFLCLLGEELYAQCFADSQTDDRAYDARGAHKVSEAATEATCAVNAYRIARNASGCGGKPQH